jgi:hypothetical protein
VLHDAGRWPPSEIAGLLDFSLSVTKQRVRRKGIMLVIALAEGKESRVANMGVSLGCWATRQKVSDNLDGDCTSEQRAELEAHLAGCSTCPPLYRAFVSGTASLRTLSDPDGVILADIAVWTRARTGIRPACLVADAVNVQHEEAP